CIWHQFKTQPAVDFGRSKLNIGPNAVSQVFQNDRRIDRPAALRLRFRSGNLRFSGSINLDAVVRIGEDVQTNGTAIESVELTLGEERMSVARDRFWFSGTQLRRIE